MERADIFHSPCTCEAAFHVYSTDSVSKKLPETTRKEKETYIIDHKITLIRCKSLPDITIAGYVKDKVSDQLYNNASTGIAPRERVHKLDVNAEAVSCRA